MKELYCLYMHISPEGMRYIGKTSRKPKTRWTQGTRYTKNKDFFADILRLGGEGQFLSVFDHYILSPAGDWFLWKDGMAIEETNFFNQKEAVNLEQKWIAFYTFLNPKKIYNRSSGGDKGFVFDSIAKEHNRQAHIGLYDGEKNPFFGMKHTEEVKLYLSELAKERFGQKNPFYGKHHSELTKELIRQAHIGLCAGEKNPFFGKEHSLETKEKISQQNSRPISMYSLSGQFVKTFPSVTVAAEAMGVTDSSISACATKATKTCCGMIWRHHECEQLSQNDMPPKHGLCKTIFQYDLKGNFLQQFESLKEAARTCETTPTAIVNSAKKRIKQAGGYIWRYFKCEKIPLSELPTRHKKCRRVSQHDLQGNHIRTFNSIKEAAKIVGVTPVAILRAASGQTKQSGGFIWRYLELDL